ncbi:MAG: EAL domain-containing protein [Gammaproteobacteria bacterium]
MNGRREGGMEGGRASVQAPEEGIARHKLSLKWKALLLTGLVLLVVTVAYTVLSYLNLIHQFSQQRQALYQQHVRQLERLVEQSLQRIGNFAELTPGLAGIGPALATGDKERIRLFFGDHWPNFQLSMGLESARFYDPKGALLEQWGLENFVAGAPPETPAWVKAALATENVQSALNCAEYCMQFAAAPVLARGEVAGVVEYGMPLTDIVAEFARIAGYEVALLVGSEGSNKQIPERRLRNWRMSVAALTQYEKNLLLLQQASRDRPQTKMLTAGSTNSFRGRDYEITLIPFSAYAKAGTGYFAVIADLTDPIARIQAATHRNVFLGALSLMTAVSMVAALLWRPMTRLRRTAQTLPLLGQGEFLRVRQAIGSDVKRRWLRDEVDVLDDTAIALSGRLESLEQEVMEHTRALGERMDELENERDFVRNLLDTAQVVILTQNASGEIRTINQFGLELSGHDATAILGGRFDQVFAKDGVDVRTLFASPESGPQRRIATVQTKPGPVREIDWWHTRLSRRGEEPLILSLGLDITEQRQAQRHLSWLADHDPLSGLFNRRRFQQEIRRAMAEARRYGSTGALLFFDLDQFKYINDTSGHQAGDILLKRVTSVLKNTVRETDITARLGGDEFAVLIGHTDTQGAIETARKIGQRFSEIAFPVGDRAYKVSASIGIAMFPEHARDAPDLLAAADLAMYKVKEAGRGGWQLFSQDDPSRARMHARMLWKGRVEKALEQDALVLRFQPIIDVETREITHCEALIRMLDVDGKGLIGPGEFIEACERTGLIHAIDKRVLELGIAQLALFNADGLEIGISLNLSGHAFENRDLLPTLEALLEKYQVAPGNLIFEITETAAVSDLVAARGLMQSIRAMGCHFALDDFGAGFSSLRYLRQLPVDYVKIDGSFIQNLPQDPDNQVMVKAITDVARGFGIKTVAEYVENSEILSLLQCYGVDYAQGYHISPPLAPERLYERRGVLACTNS